MANSAMLRLMLAGCCCCVVVTSSSRLVRVHSRASSNLRRDYVPAKRDQRFILRCLRDQNVPEHRHEQCRAMREVVSRMSNTSALNRRRRLCKHFPNAGDIIGLQQEYVKDIVVMNNGGSERDATYNTLKDIVASCANYSSPVRQQWREFYRGRVYEGRKIGKTIFPVSQQLDGNTVVADFNPIPDKSRFVESTPLIADLTLLRVAPCQIDERYATYEVVVEMVERGRAVVLYRAEQASCPSLEGYMMVANVDLQPVWRWMVGDANSTLTLRVHVRPLEQLLAGSHAATEGVNVLRRVLSLTVLGRKSLEAPKRTLRQPTNQGMVSSVQPGVARSRRHAVPPRTSLKSTAACQRVSYPLSFEAQWQQNMAYPASFDVMECSGVCPFPLSGRMNSTNHAIAMKLEQVYNPHPPAPPTVDCVPTVLDDLLELEVDSLGNLEINTLEEVIVKQCGCA